VEVWLDGTKVEQGIRVRGTIQRSSAVLVVCYKKVVANRASLLAMYISLYTKFQSCKFGWSLCGQWSVNIFDHNSRL